MRKVQKEEEQESKIHIKTIVLGDYGVGKTKLLMRFVSGEYREDYYYTVVGSRSMKARYDSNNFWLDLYDTYGAERFLVIQPVYMARTHAIILVFDITNQKSLDSTRFWMENYERLHNSLDVPILLVANKCDLLREDELEKAMIEFGPKIEALKQDYKCQFFVVSCRNDIGIDDAFDYLKKIVYEKYVQKLKKPWPEMSLSESVQTKPNRCF